MILSIKHLLVVCAGGSDGGGGGGRRRDSNCTTFDVCQVGNVGSMKSDRRSSDDFLRVTG